MATSYQKKTHEIKQSLVRRARLRKAYNKLLESEGYEVPSRDEAEHASGNEEEDKDFAKHALQRKTSDRKRKPVSQKQEFQRQSAKDKRLAAFHIKKEREEAIQKAQQFRQKKAKILGKKTRKGQPKLGSRIGLLLDKLKEQ